MTLIGMRAFTSVPCLPACSVELRVHASDLAREAGLGRDAVAYLLRLVGKEQWDAAGNKHATNHW